MKYYTYVLIECHKFAATPNRPASVKRESYTVECMAENRAKLFEKILSQRDAERIESITIINEEDN